jgi:hypothetical protein
VAWIGPGLGMPETVGDVTRYADGGREYAIYGLQAKAAEIQGAARRLDELLNSRRPAALAALHAWRGRHTQEFARRQNASSDAVFGVYEELSLTAMRCISFPASYTASSMIGYGFARQREGIHIAAPADDGSSSAVPADLRSYATAVGQQDGLPASAAASVNDEGLRAEVTTHRPLNPNERRLRLEDGADPRTLDEVRITSIQPISVRELITLVGPTGPARRASTASTAAAEYALAVADAFEHADTDRLELLAEHPELAAYLVPGMSPDRLAGDTAIAVLLTHFGDIDTAAHGGNADGIFSIHDLEAVRDNTALPPELRAAARYLLDNPALRALVDGSNDDGGDEDGKFAAADLQAFLDANEHLRVVQANFRLLDTAAHGGDPDGFVSVNDLKQAAENTALPQEVRDAARFLLDHQGVQIQLDAHQDGGRGFQGGFTTNDLIGRLVDGQAYADDPLAAQDFVRSLPVADDGKEGLPITLCRDDGVKALANAGLIGADGDLTDMQQVIAHLPETTSAVRNELITSFYDFMAKRADGVFSGAAGSTPGDPTSPGSPGANWLMFAPWASNGVHDAINGDFSVFGISPPMGARQAAADGNQWIFNDITARYAAFVELYESSGGQPSTAQLQTFFDTSFGDGDRQIRDGFATYVGAIDEPDPARRQQLMFRANTLVAIHEQAGAQPYLEGVSVGPDEFATEFIDVHMGRYTVEVNKDVPQVAGDNNLVVPAPILSLDPARSNAADLVPGVNLEPISGWEGKFDVSTQQWFDEAGKGTTYVPNYSPYGGGVVAVPKDVDPDQTLEGTAAPAWTDYDERMWSIHRLFEQLHADRSLFDTTPIAPTINLDWVVPGTGLQLQ